MDPQLFWRYRQKLLQEVGRPIDWGKRSGMHGKLTNVAVTVMLVCTTCGTINAQPVLKPSANSLNEAMPERVVHLFSYWPDAVVLSGPNRVSGDESPQLALVKKSSVEWIKKVLNPTWLPMKEYLEENLIMTRDELGLFDVTRIRWIKNGYNVEVSQTAGIIAIKLTPVKSVDMGKTADQKREFAKELSRQIVNNTGMRYGLRYGLDDKGKPVKKPVKVTVKDLPAKICGYSFRPELVRQFPDGIAGVATTMEDEGIAWISRDGNDVEVENREDNPDWDSSLSSWGYWWRHVCWWHDGKSVGFFTLEKEADAVDLNYWDEFGSRWFEGPTEIRK